MGGGGDMHFLLEPQATVYFILDKRESVLPSFQFLSWPRLGVFPAIFSLGGMGTDEVQCTQGPLVMGKHSKAIPEGLNSRKHVTCPYLNSGPFPSQKEFSFYPGFSLILLQGKVM